MIQANHRRTVRITQYNLRAHIDQFIDEKQSGLKHFLMNQQRSFGLSGHHQNNGKQIRCKARPWRIGNRQDRTVNKFLDFIIFLCRNENIIATQLHINSQLAECVRDETQLCIANILYGNFGTGHGGQPDPRTDLHHIRKNAVFCSVQFIHALDCQ